MHTVAALAATLLIAPPAPAAVDFNVTASVETEPVSHWFDAADDPAIWVNPADPTRSAVIGTDKQGALEVYDLTGARLQRISGDYGNNVDLRGDIVISADDEASGGAGTLHVYRIDPATRQLRLLVDVPTQIDAHGICMYRSPATGKLFALANAVDGWLTQYEISINGDAVRADPVREFDAGGAVEGCYADERTGKLYLGEEDVGVWVYGAEPGAGATRTSLDSTSGNLTADVEGIAAAGKHLFVSSQGSHDFTVYDRVSGSYLGRFAVVSGTAADDCEDTDGIDATDAALGTGFPQGVFICQDGSNGSPNSGNQNFKFVPLERITEVLR